MNSHSLPGSGGAYRFRAKSQADLHRVMTSARAAIWHAVVQTAGEAFSWDLRMTNEDAAARLWPVAVEPGEVYTLAWYRARLSEDHHKADEKAERALRDGASHYEQEFRIQLADGTFRWIAEDVQIDPLGSGRWRLVGICMDVTERRREQDTLRDVMASARCLVWQAAVTYQEGELVWQFSVMNEEAAQRWWPVPRTRDQSYSAGWAGSPLPEERARIDKTCRDALLSGKPDYHQEYRIGLASGARRWISEDVQVESQGAHHWHLVGVCIDITERKEADAQLAIKHDKDRRIADVWHRSMLHHVAAGAYDGLDVKTFYEAALEESLVGGDFFDSIALDETRVALAVGDVSGKGLAAAVYTAEIKYALRAFLFASREVGEALASLNDLICESPRAPGEEAPMATLSLVVIDRVSGRAWAANAGADPPVIIRASGTVEMLEGSGLILGVSAGALYPVSTVELGRSDTLLMVTDGITEARRKYEFFGLEGVARAGLHRGAAASLADMGQAILEAAQSHHGGMLGDDVCLLLARRL